MNKPGQPEANKPEQPVATKLEQLEANIRNIAFVSATDQRSASFWVRVIMVGVGALMAGAAQFLETPTTGVPWNHLIGFLGVGFAFAGGVWTVRADRHAAIALHEADEAVKEALAAQETNARLRIETGNAVEDLRRRHTQLRHLQGLTRILRDGVEGRLVAQRDDNLVEDIQKLLLVANRSMLAAMRCEAGERWTIHVYRETSGVLTAIAACTVDREVPAVEPRVWAIGEGYAGAAFQRGNELVLADAQARDVLAVLNVPRSKARSLDATFYQSVAAVPIRVGDMTWGVAIATSDHLGRFDRGDNTEGAFSAEAVRILAAMLALMVSGEPLSAPNRPLPLR